MSLGFLRKHISAKATLSGGTVGARIIANIMIPDAKYRYSHILEIYLDMVLGIFVGLRVHQVPVSNVTVPLPC